jgi:hypothetical protein
MNTPKRKTEANHLTFLHGLDPNQTFVRHGAIVRSRIAKRPFNWRDQLGS